MEPNPLGVMALTKPFILHGSIIRSMEEAPFMVQINVPQLNDRICGGIILNTMLILTAAHCVYDNEAQSYVPEHSVKITAGELRLGGTGASAQTRHAIEYIKPTVPYSSREYSRDIVILKLSAALDFGLKVRNVPLPSGQLQKAEIGRIYGWGLTEHDVPSETLRRADVKLLNTSICGDNYPSFRDGFQEQQLICARGTRNEGGCPGDSGSPLMCIDHHGSSGRAWLCGITSFGDGMNECSATTKPVGYVSVVLYLDWIRETITTHLSCGSGSVRFECGGLYNFQITNDGPRDHYIGQVNGLGYITKLNVSENGSGRWKLVPGLADPKCCYSLESVHNAGHYLRHQNWRFKLHANDGSDLFRQDATFFIRSQRAAGDLRFESYNFPDHYLRHYNYELWLSSGKGEGFHNPFLYKEDTTYTLTI